MSAEVAPLADNESWYKNGAGFWVSNEFGFGLLNALNMVNWATNWKGVPKKTFCRFELKIRPHQYFRINHPAQIAQTTYACQTSPDMDEQVFYLEQIILTSTIKHNFRGAISIKLKSPSGTQSELLAPRKMDKSRKGLNNWQIKSFHNWGENPRGRWEIEVHALFLKDGLLIALERMYHWLIRKRLFDVPESLHTGTVEALMLDFHGTREKPAHYNEHVPRKYSAFRTADGKSSEPLTHKQKTDGGMSA